MCPSVYPAERVVSEGKKLRQQTAGLLPWVIFHRDDAPLSTVGLPRIAERLGDLVEFGASPPDTFRAGQRRWATNSSGVSSSNRKPRFSAWSKYLLSAVLQNMQAVTM